MNNESEAEAALRAISEMFERRRAKAFVYMPGLAGIAQAMKAMSLEDMKAFREEAILLMDTGIGILEKE